jgi:hypothetical protein
MSEANPLMKAKLLQQVPSVTKSSRQVSLGHPMQPLSKLKASLELLQIEPDMSTAMHRLKS